MKLKQRRIDEQRIHEIYSSLGSRSYGDYMSFLGSKNPLCVHCLSDGNIKPGRVLDHITPINQGGGKHDEDNLQWLCDHHHNSKSGKEEYHKTGTMVNIIAGPPGSGKTTYVRKHVSEGDLVFDLDKIYQALSFQPIYIKPKELADIVFRIRDRIYRAIRETNEIKTAWIITYKPEASSRKELRDLFGADLILMDCTADVCKHRIATQDRPNTKTDWNAVVDNWFERFEPVPGEQIVSSH